MQKTRFLKVKNNLFELEKCFIDLKDRELKSRKIKVKREIETSWFFKPIIMSINDMGKFEQKEIKEKRPLGKTGKLLYSEGHKKICRWF